MLTGLILGLAVTLALVTHFFAQLSTVKSRLHLLQLEDYIPSRMMRLANRQWLRWVMRPDWFVLAWCVSSARKYAFAPAPNWYLWVNVALLTGLIVSNTVRIFRLKSEQKQAKKPLVMTSRANRIYTVAALLSFVAYLFLQMSLFSSAAGSLSRPDAANFGSFFLLYLGVMLVERLTPQILALAVFLLKPIERSIQQRFLNDAKRILAEYHPLVIGITGSYGKTGVKELLATMIAEKFSVLKPPGSYNTLMGITRLIREQLRPFHEVFVVEMGAYQIGSIQKLCDLTHPSHGIITIIGLQHLERFKTQANIQQAKGELVRSLPTDGIAVLNGDDPLSREIGKDHKGRLLYFRVEKPGSKYETDTARNTPAVVARNIQLGVTGSDFQLKFPDGESLDVHLPLLGRPAIANATAAAAMADALGVPRRAIKRALAGMAQVTHRLESKRGAGGVTVIDDAFNSNPIGAASALEVLAQATEGRRVLVTPGMVELGEMEADENRKFGVIAAKSCDLALLVGVERVQPIREGLIEGGFAEENIWVAASLREGLAKLEGWLRPGDTLLLENDLPDQYDKM